MKETESAAGGAARSASGAAGRSSRMTAQGLHRHYRSDLKAILAPSADKKHKKSNRRTARWLLRAMKSEGCLHYREGSKGGTAWIWSDLHLHHKNIIRYTKRPHRDMEAMNADLLQAWRVTVRPQDTIINGGDMAMGGGLRFPSRLREVAGCPGRKLIVRGNHDFTRKGQPMPTGCDEVGTSILIESDPPLLLTHLPMEQVPEGCINLHGHIHDHPAPSTSHINVCVEHLGYRPARLDAIRELAAALVRGFEPEDGETTLEQMMSLGVAWEPVLPLPTDWSVSASAACT